MRTASIIAILFSSITASAEVVTFPNVPARTWTSTAGTTREAIAMSVDTDANTVKLYRNRKRIDFPINQLSKVDHDWLERRLLKEQLYRSGGLTRPKTPTLQLRAQRMARSRRGDALRQQSKAKSQSAIGATKASAQRQLAKGRTAVQRGTNMGTLRRTTVIRSGWQDVPGGSVYRSTIGPEYVRYPR